MRLLIVILAVIPAFAEDSQPVKDPKDPNAIPEKAWINGGRPMGLRIAAPPFSWACDVGANEAEQKKFLQRFAGPVMETSKFFRKVFSLKDTCFEDFAKQNAGQKWEPLIRINLWRKYSDFLVDFQRRYDTKSRPGAFFGTSQERDAYAKPTGKSVREIGAPAESTDDQQLLRSLYHELGHTFMRTYMASSVEIPSWIEEGNAQLFQYRIGNGTKPENERIERQGWLREMLEEGSLIAWPEFIKVHNLDNLDFTWKDQSRSIIQYCQAWSVIEFMISNPARQTQYLRMLEKLKKSSLGAMGSKITVEADLMTYLYGIQEAVFKECYGVALTEVEDIWHKEWIIKEYQRLLPKHPLLMYHRGNWLLSYRLEENDPEGSKVVIATAEARFNECITVAPTCAEGHVGLGQIAMLRHDFAAAQIHFDEALRLDSESFDALLRGGIAKVESGKAEDAVPLLKQASLQRPTSAEAQLHLGRALAIEGRDLDSAVVALAAAAELRKDLASTCALYAGVMHFVAKDYAKASTSFLEASYARPGDSSMIMLTALAEAWGGNVPVATQYLDRVPATDSLNELRKRLGNKDQLPLITWKNGGITLVWPAAAP